MKVTFDFARKRIGIEGDGPELVSLLQLVRDIAPKLTGINIVAGEIGEPDPEPPGERNGGRSAKEAGQGFQTLREFARSLTPTNLAERIAVIGYYVAKHDGKNTFSPKEMANWFAMCGFEKPSQMSVAIFDARRKYGYLDSAGHGEWRLTTQGENLVIRKQEESQNGE